MQVKVKRLTETAKLPTKAHKFDAGIDLYYDGPTMYIRPGARVLLSTGIAVEPPQGYCLVIKDRSGIAAKCGLHVLAGVCDGTYTGEIKVCMLHTRSNFSKDGEILEVATDIKISRGDKIAQALLLPSPYVDIIEVTTLTKTDRGCNGFGSSD